MTSLALAAVRQALSKTFRLVPNAINPNSAVEIDTDVPIER